MSSYFFLRLFVLYLIAWVVSPYYLYTLRPQTTLRNETLQTLSVPTNDSQNIESLNRYLIHNDIKHALDMLPSEHLHSFRQRLTYMPRYAMLPVLRFAGGKVGPLFGLETGDGVKDYDAGILLAGVLSISTSIALLLRRKQYPQIASIMVIIACFFLGEMVREWGMGILTRISAITCMSATLVSANGILGRLGR